MAYWLLKTEPQEYSYTDLDQAGCGIWDGVKRPLGLKYLRTMELGDKVLIYHTGQQRQVVGIAEIISLPYADPKLHDPRRMVVDIRAVRSLPQPVTLTQIKQDHDF